MSFRHPTQSDFPSNRFDWLDRPEWATIDEWEQLIDFLNALDEGDVGGGTQGPQGPQGVQGPVGLQGVQGPSGTSFVWRGTWNGGTAYVTNDAVERSGETYIALQNSTNQDPAVSQPDNLFWDVLSVMGVQGPTGADGPQGVTGPTGATGAAGPPFDFEQTTDPGAVGAGKWWADLTPGLERVGRRNATNTAWVFFPATAGGGFVLSPSGDSILDSSGNPILFLQGIGASRVLTDSATLTFNFSTPGVVQPETA